MPRQNKSFPAKSPRNGVIAPTISSTVSSARSPPSLPSVAATATSTAAMTSWVATAPMAVSSRAEGRSAVVRPFSATEDCWKNTIQGMITAPMLAEASRRYLGSVIGIVSAPEITSSMPGWASKATNKNQFESADRNRDALHRHVAVHERHRQQRRHHQRQRERGRNAKEVAHTGKASKLGQERAEAGDDQG